MSIEKLNSFVDVLRYWAVENGDSTAYTFLRNGEDVEKCISFRDLDIKARNLAAVLQGKELQNERVLLLYPSSIEYVISLLGCFYAGVIAIPVYPPRNSRGMPRIQSIVEDAHAKAILTTEKVSDKIHEFTKEMDRIGLLDWIITDKIESGLENRWLHPDLTGENIAYLQYTSGSTGSPKGVMVSHGNLLSNSRQICGLFNHTQQSKMVTWLPIFHDLGLIYGLLQPLYAGFSCIFMSPAAFLQQPYRWLKAISDFKATSIGAPNFAYELCVKKITEKQKLNIDLSSLNVALNGAEPVRSSTIESFYESFKQCGFNKTVMSPCYGLAEATLVVTGTAEEVFASSLAVDSDKLEADSVKQVRQFSDNTRSLVSSGVSFEDQIVKIVDPLTYEEVESTKVGEIWVSGPSVAKGYWQKEEETESTFGAQIIGDIDNRYLRTGDLGFKIDGQVYITGRLKDVVIIRGRNLYPQDIELVTESSHDSLRMTGAAAFSVHVNGEERLVVVQELDFRCRPAYDEVFDSIRNSIVEEFNVQPYAICLIKPGSIYKTSSGKIQRKLTRESYLNNKLYVVKQWREDKEKIVDQPLLSTNSDSLSRQILFKVDKENRKQIVNSFLRVNLANLLDIDERKIDMDQSLILQGLDSLMAASLTEIIGSKLDVDVSIEQLFDATSLSKLSIDIIENIGA